ncbi:MAG: DUF402 domain-containing protein [Pyrinomonadaceae bacterium]
MIGQEFTITSRKYDLSIRRSWKCRLIDQTDRLYVFLGEFDELVEHPKLGVIEKGTFSREYYWLDNWYNVFRFEDCDGNLRNFYCNITKPPMLRHGVLDYVDLDIDLIVWPNGQVEILDEDEFATNAKAFNYPPELRDQAFTSLSELRQLIEAREFPFASL